MTLAKKKANEVIPQYSLTGDLLSFLRCGLQYRYHNGSALPPSRPVQMWFGEFIHGVMENAYRIWSVNPPSFPWPYNPTPYRGSPPPGRLAHDVGTLGDVVESTLLAQGKAPRSRETRESAYLRAERAINELGPHLFPLISSAEERVIGTRDVPAHAQSRASLYELHGIIDVLGSVKLGVASGGNVLCEAIQAVCPSLKGDFEIIVDYKGSRRPRTDHPYWEHGDWQVQTYAWLRTRQPKALPVVAGILLYVNELAPGTSGIVELKQEIAKGITDVVPANGDSDYYALSAWRPGAAVPALSPAFRMRRAIRVIPVNPASQQLATAKFDNVVADIETCVTAEAGSGKILQQWKSCGEEETCVACDFRHFCPDRAPRSTGKKPSPPGAPETP